MTILKYKEARVLSRARQLLLSGEDFAVSVEGWRAKLINRSLPILLDIQSFDPKGSQKKMHLGDFFSRFIPLHTLLSPLMTVIWLAVANGKKIEIRLREAEVVDLEFKNHIDTIPVN